VILAAPASVGNHSLVVRTVASTGLAGTMLDFPDAPLDDDEWRSLLGEVRAERVTGLLWHAITEGRFPVTDAQAEEAETMQVRALAGALVLERLLLDTVTQLEQRGVPVRALKGSAVAHLDYPDPSLRAFGDIDLMVPGGRFDDAVAVLVEQGHRRAYPQPRPGFDRRFSKGASFRTSDGLEVDLHRTFTMGPYGVRLDLDRVWERCERFDLGREKLCALGPEERLLHACYHAILGETSPRLTPLRDIAQMALTRQLDLPRLHALIRASHGEPVVAKAIRAAWSELHIADVTALSAWAQTYRTDPHAAADLATYGAGSSYATKSIAAIRSLPTMRDRASFLYALLVPTSSYVVNRHAGRMSRLYKAFRQRRPVSVQ
jgi:putative nucleotidyltransferase-like protein